MNKPFKFRYVNELVGSFVLLILILVAGSLIMAGRIQGWFEPQVSVFTEFPDEGAFGLREGDPVEILGTQAGTLKAIRPQPGGTIEGEMSIKGRFMQYVRIDSVAMVRNRLGLGGDVYIEITRGTGGELEGDRPAIPSERDTQLLETVQEKIEELERAVQPILAKVSDLLDKVNLLLDEYTKLAADLRDPEGELQGLIARLNAIARGLDEGEGSAGRLLKDPEAAEELVRLLRSATAGLDELEGALANLREASGALPAMAGAAGETVRMLPDVLTEAEAAIEESRRLIEGAQRHWLIRKYIEDGGEPARLPPSVLHEPEPPL